MTKIDVLLPVYNCEKYITSALKSIQDQTIRDIRIIVVDDGSADNTGPLVLAESQSDARIVYHRQDNAGIVVALNNGLALCDAPFIARMDGDDISCPDRFAKELAYLEANPDCVAVSGRARHIDQNSSPLGTISTRKESRNADPCAIPAVEPYLLHPMLMARREALIQVGGYRDVYQSEDSDLYWRLSDIGSLYVLPEVVGDYRIHTDSVSSSSVVNGRQQAIWSQLAALSEQRRRKKENDLRFTKDFANDVKTRRGLAQAVAVASRGLSQSETAWFGCAVSAKLLELSYYRPYEPDTQDIAFIRHAIASDPDLKSRKSYGVIREAVLSCAVRLVGAGRYKDAVTLTGTNNIPKLIGRSVFRHILPKGLAEKIKQLVKAKKHIL
ncbi:glycosyltransferase family 2 protein [Acetobacter oeni]|uniref:Glycosyltransferase 2-like domain-containing protein n=1 Tax=Acetobacter oeni TaxID=304077 RepID=A0A511XM30_9PROT|nr:glycosyltransferase [Acetobacter oeni]MBB3883998.1 glycosyltransferase involved in cell wall biosynthesis [Acetobacter oeni]NHO20057.1 glycosyltransferase [Acetobacter oeni]GBR03795.1 glycosyltransferase [Acetobacter oeni LMG 21952]GEN63988.1 hypothetical protein AOE01nite_22120 [Acetobacter oeni]